MSVLSEFAKQTSKTKSIRMKLLGGCTALNNMTMILMAVPILD